MKIVDVVQRQHVNDTFNIVDAKKMSAFVNHKATIGKTRTVGNLHGRQRHLLDVLAIGGQCFDDCLNAVEHSLCRTAFNYDASRIGFDGILFVSQCVVERKHNFATAFLGAFGHGDVHGISNTIDEHASISVHVLALVACFGNSHCAAVFQGETFSFNFVHLTG